jgi:hypothetical protein
VGPATTIRLSLTVAIQEYQYDLNDVTNDWID